MRNVIVAAMWLVGGISAAYAQVDSTAMVAARNYAVQAHHHALGGRLLLYNGREYHPMSQLGVQYLGHPFFLISEAAPGTIMYGGALYTDALLQYDLVQDQLVVTIRGTILRVVLMPHLVSSFWIEGHPFICHQESIDSTGVEPGYYEVLHRGKNQILARHRKVIVEQNHTWVVRKSFSEKKSLFVKKGERYYAFRNSKTLFRILGLDRNFMARVRKVSGLREKDTEHFAISAMKLLEAESN